MLRHKHPDNRNERLKDVLEFLLRDLVPILGFAASIDVWPSRAEEKAVWSDDGGLKIRLPTSSDNVKSYCLMLSPEAAQDKLCRKVCGEFIRLCRNVLSSKGQWDIKARLIKSGDFLWDDLVVSLGLSGNQKYECIDILSAVRESLLFEYEGIAVQIGVLVTWNLHNTRRKFEEADCILLPFNLHFDLRENLKNRKALNRISTVRSSVILVSKDSLASHLILIPSMLRSGDTSDWELVPENIQRLRQFLMGRDVLVAGSHAKELFFATHEYVFRWGHKKWSRLSGPALSSVLGQFVDDIVVQNLRDVVVAMSQAKIGALFVITQDPISLLKGAKEGVSRQFKSECLFNIKDVDKWATIRFAAIDGATILTRSGQIVEAGSILAIPESSASLAEGARTAAAVHASKFGLAIKVSSDGPISMYVKGKLVRST